MGATASLLGRRPRPARTIERIQQDSALLNLPTEIHAIIVERMMETDGLALPTFVAMSRSCWKLDEVTSAARRNLRRVLGSLRFPPTAPIDGGIAMCVRNLILLNETNEDGPVRQQLQRETLAILEALPMAIRKHGIQVRHYGGRGMMYNERMSIFKNMLDRQLDMRSYIGHFEAGYGGGPLWHDANIVLLLALGDQLTGKRVEEADAKDYGMVTHRDHVRIAFVK